MIKTIEIAPVIVGTEMAIALAARWGEFLETDYGGEPIGFDVSKLAAFFVEFLDD